MRRVKGEDLKIYIEYLLLEGSLSKVDLAKRLGVTPATVSKILHQPSKNLQMRTSRNYFDRLGITSEDFFRVVDDVRIFKKELNPAIMGGEVRLFLRFRNEVLGETHEHIGQQLNVKKQRVAEIINGNCVLRPKTIKTIIDTFKVHAAELAHMNEYDGCASQTIQPHQMKPGFD